MKPPKIHDKARLARLLSGNRAVLDGTWVDVSTGYIIEAVTTDAITTALEACGYEGVRTSARDGEPSIIRFIDEFGEASLVEINVRRVKRNSREDMKRTDNILTLHADVVVR